MEERGPAAMKKTRFVVGVTIASNAFMVVVIGYLLLTVVRLNDRVASDTRRIQTQFEEIDGINEDLTRAELDLQTVQQAKARFERTVSDLRGRLREAEDALERERARPRPVAAAPATATAPGVAGDPIGAAAEAEALRAQLQALLGERDTLEKRMTDATARVTELEGKLAEASQQNRKLHRVVVAARHKVREIRSDAATLRYRIMFLEQERKRLTSENRRLRKKELLSYDVRQAPRGAEKHRK